MQAQRPQLGRQIAVAAGGVGLALERTQLPPHLAQQVVQAQEVALGGLEPALGLLLAAPVLEHARRLLDDGPAVLWARRQYRVQLTLGDDDVLGAAHAAVGQQLLHVEEPARHAVDGVLALAGRPEQRAGDRHLGELDREQAGRVVDGQGDLGPSQRRPVAAAGEDDVVHLRRAQRPGALGPQHPRHGVHQVGLAAAVGAHDDGHARLEVERGVLREGLEPLQGEGLQEHLEVRLWARKTVAADPQT